MSPREGIELFDAGDGGLAVIVGLTVLEEGCEDLTGAHDDALDFVVRSDLEFGVFGVHGVGDDPLEVAFACEV